MQSKTLAVQHACILDQLTGQMQKALPILQILQLKQRQQMHKSCLHAQQMPGGTSTMQVADLSKHTHVYQDTVQGKGIEHSQSLTCCICCRLSTCDSRLAFMLDTPGGRLVQNQGCAMICCSVSLSVGFLTRSPFSKSLPC